MKRLLAPFVLLAVLLAGVASNTDVAASQQDNATDYYLVILDSLDGTDSAGISLNHTGLVAGYSNLPGDGIRHAVIWQDQTPFDLGTLGGSDRNSSVAWPVKNNKGVIVGIAETDEMDPYMENWSCSAFFPSATHHQCLGFVWRNGDMDPLPTLGGTHGYAAGINNQEQIVGWAENTVVDSTCQAPQRFQFRAVVWGPKEGQKQELLPYGDDPTSAATAINDNGQIVGISGICDQAVGRLSAINAVTWEKGNIYKLDDIGVGSWNTPTAINQRGDISGFVNQPGLTITGLRPRGVVWTKNPASSEKKYELHLLPFLPGDIRSFAWSINDSGLAVGQSYGGPSGSRAVIWDDGVVTDLNTLTAPGSLPLIFANDINDRGEISGQAFDPDTGELVAFKAIPPVGGLEGAIAAAHRSGRETTNIVVPEKVLKRALRRLGINEIE